MDTNLMIVSQIVKGEIESWMHLKTCTGTCGAKIVRGQRGVAAERSHPGMVKKVRLAPCTPANAREVALEASTARV